MSGFILGSNILEDGTLALPTVSNIGRDIVSIGTVLTGTTIAAQHFLRGAHDRALPKTPSKNTRNINHTEISPDDVSSFPNIPPDRHDRMPLAGRYNAKGGQFSNVPNDGEEVAVVPPPAKVAKILSDYTTIKFPYHDYVCGRIDNGNPVDNLAVRLNSIQDPLVTVANHRPQGYTNWSGLYKYYRVLECEINVTVKYVFGNFVSGNAAAQNVPCSFSLACGYEPTDDVTDIFPNFVSMVEGKHSKVVWLDPKDMEVGKYDNTNPHNSHLLFHGGQRDLHFHYDPHQWDYHVHELGVEERWTLMANNPDVLHFLNFKVMTPGRAGEVLVAGNFINYRLDINISYTAQLRESLHTKAHNADSIA